MIWDKVMNFSITIYNLTSIYGLVTSQEAILIFMPGYTADVIAHHRALRLDVKCLLKVFSMKEFANIIRAAFES